MVSMRMPTSRFLKLGSPSFAPRLLSYLDHEDVFLGNEVLDAGAIWALGRLGPRAEGLEHGDMAGLLGRFLAEGGALVRGAAAWTAGRLGVSELFAQVRAAATDPETAPLLVDGRVEIRPVGEWAAEAAALLRV